MLFSLTLSAVIVCAQTQYVSDELVITLREGQGSQYKIIKMLKTGTPLEIIEESDPYLKVRTEKGDEGWVLNQYITEETPKPQVIADLKIKIDRLNTKIEQYEKNKESFQEELNITRSDSDKEIKGLRQNLSDSTRRAEQTARELKAITRKYNALLEDSKDVVQLVEERDSLKESNHSLKARTEQLQEENDKLNRMEMIWWFVAGGGVLFVGWIIGKVSRQKRFY
jgi:SH3 domain protein